MPKKGKKKKVKNRNAYTKILNIGYGVLNPIRDSLTGKNFDSSDVTPIDLVRSSYKAHFSANTFVGTGPYSGIVLRDDKETSKQIVDSSSWVAGPFSYHLTDEEEGGISKEAGIHLPALKQLRVRIPEIHASLPIPKYLPKVEEQSAEYRDDHLIINQYPVFVAQNGRISKHPVAAGDLVWVDFQNKNTLEGGIYIGPVNEKAGMPAPSKGSTSYGGAKSAFNKEKCLEAGGLECELMSPDAVSYNDGELRIYPGRPTLSKSPENIVTKMDFTKIVIDPVGSGGREGTIYGSLKSSGYDQILSTFHKDKKGNNQVINRPRFFGYGYPEDNQMDPTNEFSGFTTYNGVHKLITPRLRALNEFWGHFYRAFTAGNFGNVTSDNFKYTESGDAKVKPYQEKFLLSATMVKDIGGKALTPSNVKKYLVKELGKPDPSIGSQEGQVSFKKKTIPGCSNHATGLAFDITNNGLCPRFATARGYDVASKGGTHVPQYASIGWMFMMKYAWLFGFYSYHFEAWHWELKPPRNCWHSGDDYCASQAGNKKGYRKLERTSLDPDCPSFADLKVNSSKYDEVPLTIEEFNAAVESSPLLDSIRAQMDLDSTGGTEAEKFATARKAILGEVVDASAQISLKDLTENEIIVPNKALREVYKNELAVVFGANTGDKYEKIKFPYAVFVRESDSHGKEISGCTGASTIVSDYLDNAGYAGPKDIQWTSGEQRVAIREILDALPSEITSGGASTNYFYLPYMTIKGKGLKERDLRELGLAKVSKG